MKTLKEMREAVKASIDGMDDFRVRAMYYHECMTLMERMEFLGEHLCCNTDCPIDVKRCNLSGSICDKAFVVGRYVKRA